MGFEDLSCITGASLPRKRNHFIPESASWAWPIKTLSLSLTLWFSWEIIKKQRQAFCKEGTLNAAPNLRRAGGLGLESTSCLPGACGKVLGCSPYHPWAPNSLWNPHREQRSLCPTWGMYYPLEDSIGIDLQVSAATSIVQVPQGCIGVSKPPGMGFWPLGSLCGARAPIQHLAQHAWYSRPSTLLERLQAARTCSLQLHLLSSLANHLPGLAILKQRGGLSVMPPYIPVSLGRRKSCQVSCPLILFDPL